MELLVFPEPVLNKRNMECIRLFIWLQLGRCLALNTIHLTGHARIHVNCAMHEFTWMAEKGRCVLFDFITVCHIYNNISYTHEGSIEILQSMRKFTQLQIL